MANGKQFDKEDPTKVAPTEDDSPPISEDLRKRTESGTIDDAWKAAHGMASEPGHDHEHEHGPVHSDQTGRRATEDWKHKGADEAAEKEK